MNGDTGDPAAVSHRSFATTDAEQISDTLTQLYTGSRARVLNMPERASFSVLAGQTGDLRADRLRSSLDYFVQCEPITDVLTIENIHAGSLAITMHRHEERYLPGHSAIQPPGAEFDSEIRDLDMNVITLPMARIIEAAAVLHGPDAAAGLAFTGIAAATPALDRYWFWLSETVHREVMNPDSALAGNPLLVEHALSMLAGAALLVFPYTTGAPPGSEPEAAGTAALARAIEYLRTHADRPVTVGELAEVAGVTARALQYGFRRHYDTTPMGYLRRVRLERAHAELLAADPARGDTVAVIARRWGHANLSRFAARYQRQYGQPPAPRCTVDHRCPRSQKRSRRGMSKGVGR
ncbi:helix-turn-helix transcriptional regulator [Nocardia sp. NPDC057353]|uniref:helix-turn-helix transcriptional regulator n=1 Tax=Nocardia sp. NPDC057353 TaxID=3346104 RepID=UPI00363E3284